VGNCLVKPKGFQKFTPTDQALQIWFDTLKIVTPKVEHARLNDALGRILAVNLVTCEAVPRFDKSAMDGYALKAADVEDASQSKPAMLKVVNCNVVKAGQARQVWTGNPIPEGADAVIMLEYTQRKDQTLEVYDPLVAGENIVKTGEDVKAGVTVAETGTRINPYHLGMAAALGYATLPVAVKPKIAIIATGNEIAEVGAKRLPHQIYDSNGTMISAMCHELGAETINLGIVKDDMEAMAQKIQTALKTADAVFTLGGTSVGGLDLVPDVVNKLGKPGVVVHGMALRPAMPTGVGVLDGKPILILSGNPVSSVIGFEVFGRPLICRMLGMPKEEPHVLSKAKLTRKVAVLLGRKTFVRVKVSLKDGELIAEPISAKGSGAISTMTQSNGYVIVPEDREGLTEGEMVLVQMFSS
jgi:molybdopterin molybdotransferase